MLKREATFWHRDLRPMLSTVPNGDIRRIENALEKGTPDVNGCLWETDFWMELKVLEKLPKDPKAIVNIDHYTQDQRLWIRRRGMAGGRVFLVLKVNLGSVGRKPEYFVFGWEAAVQYVGRVPVDVLRTEAKVWTRGTRFPLEAFKVALLQSTHARYLAISET